MYKLDNIDMFWFGPMSMSWVLCIILGRGPRHMLGPNYMFPGFDVPRPHTNSCVMFFQ